MVSASYSIKRESRCRVPRRSCSTRKRRSTARAGTIRNSNALLEDVKKSVLAWQRIPDAHWDRFRIILPSDAGTGAIETAIHVALMIDGSLNAIGIEELGWPAYRTMAKANRLGVREYGQEALINEPGVLPIYQAGPMDATDR